MQTIQSASWVFTGPPKKGKLDQSQTFTELCQVFEDRLRRESSDNKNMKYGTRYPKTTQLYDTYAFLEGGLLRGNLVY